MPQKELSTLGIVINVHITICHFTVSASNLLTSGKRKKIISKLWKNLPARSTFCLKKAFPMTFWRMEIVIS